MPFISALSLRIPVRSPTLIGLDLPKGTLVGIAEKRKKLLSCTQETISAKHEQLAQQDLSTVNKRPPLDMQWL
jgi:hypothetical protein